MKYLKQAIPHLDIVVNNAAQTIRRPAQFYSHLIGHEARPHNQLPENQQGLLVSDQPLNYGPLQQDKTQLEASDDLCQEPAVKRLKLDPDTHDQQTKAPTLAQNATSLTTSLHTQQTPSPENHKPDTKLHNKPDTLHNSSKLVKTDDYFPVGVLDKDGQQVDLRPTNSWRSVLDQVPLVELAEVLMVNTVAPFVLTQELKPLLQASPHSRKFIVNVSAMEGQFNRKSKTEYHPHTNMAKAALNMMTRTAALGYQKDAIFMTCVDTGWVTDERPYKQAQYESREKGFVLPLDVVDGAARVYHPIIHGLDEANKPHFALFLKNYKPHQW